MDFYELDTTILHADSSATFEFAPIAGAVFFAKSRQITDALAFGDCLDIGDLADDLKVHFVILSETGARHKSAKKSASRMEADGTFDRVVEGEVVEEQEGVVLVALTRGDGATQ